MPPLSTKVEFCRLYPNRPEYLFLAVFAFFSPFCYAKTAFSYSRALLSPCTPVLFMVKDVVKSVSEKMICGHHFEVRKCSEKSSAGREEKHWDQRKNTPTIACGLPDKKQRKYVVRRRANHMVKSCGRRRESHSIPSSAGVVL